MFRANIKENLRHYCIKQLHNNTWSVEYVDPLVIIHVAICYTGCSGLKQYVDDMHLLDIKIIEL